MLKRRHVLGGFGAAICSLPFGSGACGQTPVEVFRPEDFGARGDGLTNDSEAFADLSQAVTRAGGGTVMFRPVTYLVGLQRQGSGNGPAHQAARLLEFIGCTRPLILRGNGATIRCAPGLRYGAFEPRTGRRIDVTLPNYDRSQIAMPYAWMIMAKDCSGTIEISDLELDGNLQRLQLGGPWGDVGRQIHAYGIGLYNNRGRELVRNVYTHHHGLDGIIVDGLDRERPVRSLIERVRSEHNARQGCTVVGGRGYDFVDCRFAHTGKAGLVSPPGAGVDIEAEEKRVRDVTFTNCEFADNSGPSLLADSGDSEGAVFRNCTFIGTTHWSAWPKKPYFRFYDSLFVGALVQAFTDATRPERATQFHNCTFRDDPALSPTGQVFRGHAGTIAELSDNPNVIFSRCAFQLTHQATLPWTNAVTFDTCNLVQASKETAFPRGRYIGRNAIEGPVVLSGSFIAGELTVNGQVVPRGPVA